MIKVTRNRVFDGHKTYEIGDTINTLTKEDEESLVLEGVAEYMGDSTPLATSTNSDKKEDVEVADDLSLKEEPQNIFDVDPSELVEENNLTKKKKTK